jgi:hypothetical protein
VLHPRVGVGRERTLLISLGASKVEVAMRIEGEPPTELIHSDENIERRDNLGDIFSQIKKSLDAKGLRLSGRDNFAVSWPGPIEGKKLHSSWLGLSTYDEIKEYAEKLIAKAPRKINNKNFEIKCDAQTNVEAEFKNPMGRLKRGRGLVLNIGSGLCAGYLMSKDDIYLEKHGGDYEKLRSAVPYLNAIGRWLLIDPNKGTVYRYSELIENKNDEANALKRRTFGNRMFETERMGEKELVRCTNYISTHAILERYFIRIGKQEVERLSAKLFGERSRELIEERDTVKTRGRSAVRIFEEKSQITRKYLTSLNRQSLEILTGDSADGGIEEELRNLINEVAIDLVRVVKKIEDTLKNVLKISSELFPTREQIVLTGTVGRLFGSIDNDLLIRKMNQHLDDCVSRSELMVSSVGEVEAFTFGRNEKNV